MPQCGNQVDKQPDIHFSVSTLVSLNSLEKQPKPDVVKTGLKILGLTTLGTAALVGAHHLGRKQYSAHAKLSDYIAGVTDVFTSKINGLTPDSTEVADSKQDVSKPEISEKRASVDYSHKTSLPTGQRNQQSCWVSGVADLKSSEFGVVGIAENREIVWQTPMSERVHDILIQPVQVDGVLHRQVTVMGRRPSEHFWVLSADTGKVLYHVKSEPHRHYYGHACYSLDGQWLYVTENNTDTFAGVIGVYDVVSGYKKVREFETQGIGPHELVMHPDGNTLVVANGGIKTEKASRDELNLDSMQPSLVYINRHNGELLEQVCPEHNQMSVRHLSMHADGTVAIGIQFQGERHMSVPLVLTHKRGEPELTALTLPNDDKKGWHRFHHYIASVVVDSQNNVLCVTSPIGGCAAVFDLGTGIMIDTTELPDCAGAAVWVSNSNQAKKHIASAAYHSSFLVSDGRGYLTKLSVLNYDDGTDKKSKLDVHKQQRAFAFDNHMQPL